MVLRGDGVMGEESVRKHAAGMLRRLLDDMFRGNSMYWDRRVDDPYGGSRARWRVEPSRRNLRFKSREPQTLFP
jgi:hypothetical protein